MPLPYPPLLTGDAAVDVQALYTYLYEMAENFDNAAGSAIDPSIGQGGDSALTIVDIPTGITYTPGSSLSIDGNIFGHIDVTFTKPDRVVDIIVFYREVSELHYKQSYASESPFRLISLMVGTEYQIYLAGQAANGSLGPVSPVVTVTIPTEVIQTGVPINFVAQATYQSVVLTWDTPVGGGVTLEYEIQRASDALFTTGVVNWLIDSTKFVDDTGVIETQYWYKVRSVDKTGNTSAYTTAVTALTANVPDNSIITSKILNSNVTYGKIQDVTASRLLLRGSAAGNGVVQEGTVGALLRVNGTVLEADPDTGWSTTGVTPDKALTVGDTLAQTQDVLGTLIATLITKGVLSA